MCPSPQITKSQFEWGIFHLPSHCKDYYTKTEHNISFSFFEMWLGPSHTLFHYIIDDPSLVNLDVSFYSPNNPNPDLLLFPRIGI